MTSQVRLERALVPRAPAILALTEQVIEAIRHIDQGWAPEQRRVEIRRALVGEIRWGDTPVVLVSERAVTRPPGLYEMDELRLAEPVVDRIAELGAEDPGDVLVLDDGAIFPTEARGSTTSTATRTERRTRVVPQGVYSLAELIQRLELVGTTEDEIVEAIRSTPTVGSEGAERARSVEPWRVVITCPEHEGLPPTSHRTVFTGTGDTEPAVMIGTSANGVDAALEISAAADLEPRNAVATLERRLKVLLFAELAVVAVGVVFAWATGALGLAAREAPGWLGLAVVLGLSAITLAAIPLFAGNRTRGNADDTFELRRYYASRVELLSIAPAVSAGLFALAILFAVVAPSLALDDPLPPVSIAFDDSTRPVTADVAIAGTGIATDETLHVELRSFTSFDDDGSVVGAITTTGTPSGDVPLRHSVAMGSEARYLSVQLWITDAEDDPAVRSLSPTCSPSIATSTGCTIVAVPSSSATETDV